MPRLLYADTEPSKQVHTNPFEWVPTMSVFSSYSSTIKYINLQALREKKRCDAKKKEEMRGVWYSHLEAELNVIPH